ncbi:hypothetical protein CYR55_13740 [Chimaeribacter californicus]|uniref:Uncharacterized protein n=1 Tax=Chimaeribacter californicus TaxID=2060067 RepID=A0A2N5E3R6_9GAMM|nr:hypothetical protein [Chimaeribacter californicus]PLR35467.1 hypothetical protein CYR55_13740 [Chimaeribacter californicus]
MTTDRLASDARSERVCFNYMEYLSASCKKQWRFVDAIYGVMPIFGLVLKSRTAHAQSRQEQLKELALQVVSTQVSDEVNIARLILLARQQGLLSVDICLPYALTPEQLAVVREECEQDVVLVQHGECLTVTLNPATH